MTQDRMASLFFELFDHLPRQGPGDEASTRRALALVTGVGPTTRVLDIGCGSGAQTCVLALNSPAHIVAIDMHPPYVEELKRRARALGLADRIDARVGDMRRLDVAHGSFDLVWSEGAIYAVGFETGLRAWRPALAPGGHVAVTEVCWTTRDVPPALAAFWEEEYPAIRPGAALLDIIDACGYALVDHFTLPPSAWWQDYYDPLQRNLAVFGERHRGEADAQQLACRVQREIDVRRAYAEFYAYEFFVMRVR